MAGSSRYTAILDACVLYPAPIRDLLISLSSAGLFHARWTDQIQDEWMRNLLENRKDLTREKLSRTVELMEAAVEDCKICNFEVLIGSLSLPDPDDRHVLAAAIAGHGDAIISFNLADFPEEAVSTFGIEVLHPDDFLMAQYDLSQIGFLSVVKAIRERLRNPRMTAEEFISNLEQLGLPQTCQVLRKAIELI